MIGPWLAGEKVYLRAPRDSDLRRRVQWLNDFETYRLFTGSIPAQPYQLAEAMRWRQTMESDVTALLWSIETTNHRHIGDIDLHDIDSRVKMARLTILIGDKEYWGKGYGTDAIRTLLHYAFSELGLESVSLRVYNFNTRAIRCYEKCGFKQVGDSADNPWASDPGQVYMTITCERFYASNPNASLVHS